MLKKIVISIVIFCTFGISVYGVDISAKSAVVMVAETGEVLYSKNPDKRMSMASTTKIMTSLLAIENGNLNQEIVVKDSMINVEGTSMGLLAGDKVSLYELVCGMLLQSGNDAANVTAYTVGGSIDKFIAMMNSKAKQIGMNNTNFVTPSGLDDKNHYSSAYDMALLGSYAINNHIFRSICSKSTMKLTYGNPPYLRTLSNHNRLLRSYENCIGIKTGFTKKSGRCLVSSAEKDGIILVAVTLSDPDDWSDHKKLLDYGFSVVKKHYFREESFSVNVIGGNCSKVKVSLHNKPYVPIYSDNTDFSRKVILKSTEFAPVKKGDILGKAVYYSNDKQILEIPIVADDNVKIVDVVTKVSLKDKILKLLKR